jgi:hypothetical protein
VQGGFTVAKSEKKSPMKAAKGTGGRGPKKPAAKAGAAKGIKTKSSPRTAKRPEVTGAGKSPVQGPQKKYLKTVCRVTFRLPREAAAFAGIVNLVGDFNQWNREASPMKKLRDGSFSVTVSLPKGKAYHFRYLIDGFRWENDWCADAYVRNPYAGDDSVVIIE